MAASVEMDRAGIIRDLSSQMDTLAKSHIQHHLGQTQAIAQMEEKILHFIKDHNINVTEELDPIHKYYYWRFLT